MRDGGLTYHPTANGAGRLLLNGWLQLIQVGPSHSLNMKQLTHIAQDRYTLILPELNGQWRWDNTSFVTRPNSSAETRLLHVHIIPLDPFGVLRPTEPPSLTLTPIQDLGGWKIGVSFGVVVRRMR